VLKVIVTLTFDLNMHKGRHLILAKFTGKFKVCRFKC